jgi:hypothetical protein
VTDVDDVAVRELRDDETVQPSTLRSLDAIA